MHYIFISTEANQALQPLMSIDKTDLQFCSFKHKYLSEFRFMTKNKNRILNCFSYKQEFEKEIYHNKNSVSLFHGYLLRDNFINIDDMNPQACYYGVYSHGKVTEENCFFASDEIGLSPIYYSNEKGILFISNNPHLIAFYKLRLGFRICPEPTLPVWHTIGITIESDNTGYEGIFRLKPWRYISVDPQDNINFPSKERLQLPTDYETCVSLCIQELRHAMPIIKNNYSKLTSQLTGGQDSRLVLSFILNAGFENDFEFHTIGNETNPDVIVSKMLSDQYGLNHIVSRKNAGMLPDAERVRDICIANAMESSLLRLHNFVKPSSHVLLNGFGAIFAKSLNFAHVFTVLMSRNFRNEKIDFDNLTQIQQGYGHECYGYSNSDQIILTDTAIEISKWYRKYIFEFGHSKFPENMVYADCMTAYRWRTHNASLATSESNCIFLYSPIVLETSRKLTPKLRQEAKLYFDMMWRIKPELCFVPYENRQYDPEVYKEFPSELQKRLSEVASMAGDITREDQKSVFHDFLPTLRQDLIEMLPQNVFDYIKRDALEERLKEDIPFGKPVFPLLNLYGIVKWHEIVDDLNKMSFKQL